jgi:hypothetical protein
MDQSPPLIPVVLNHRHAVATEFLIMFFVASATRATVWIDLDRL